jgi:hypothetical protein
MIASKAKSSLFFSACINQNILNFPVMSNSPGAGRFSVGEPNVI